MSEGKRKLSWAVDHILKCIGYKFYSEYAIDYYEKLYYSEQLDYHEQQIDKLLNEVGV